MAEKRFEFFNPRKIEVDVQMLDGTMAHLECEVVTNEMVKAIGVASREADKKPDEVIAKQMEVFFGGDWREYYTRYDNRVLQNVIRWMTEQMRNPT